MVLYYPLRNYRSRGDATVAGAEALPVIAKKSVEENIVRISTGPFPFFLPSFRRCMPR